MDKLTAIKRMVELSIVDLQNIIDSSEKRLSIIEKRIDEYDLKDNLTDIQEERLDQWREEFDELEDEIDQLTDIKKCEDKKNIHSKPVKLHRHNHLKM